MSESLVSVIVPCYNMEQYVARMIESLLKNKYANKQIILVNDGSTDKTLSILRSYETKYSCITVVDKLNGGVSSARNAALDIAEGDFVMFADPDDDVSTDFIATAVQAISVDHCDIVSFGFQCGENKFSPKFGYYRNRNEVLSGFFPLFFSYTKEDVEKWLSGGG